MQDNFGDYQENVALRAVKFCDALLRISGIRPIGSHGSHLSPRDWHHSISMRLEPAGEGRRFLEVKYVDAYDYQSSLNSCPEYGIITLVQSCSSLDRQILDNTISNLRPNIESILQDLPDVSKEIQDSARPYLDKQFRVIKDLPRLPKRVALFVCILSEKQIPTEKAKALGEIENIFSNYFST